MLDRLKAKVLLRLQRYDEALITADVAIDGYQRMPNSENDIKQIKELK